MASISASAIIGTVLAGGVYVPIFHSLPEARISKIIEEMRDTNMLE